MHTIASRTGPVVGGRQLSTTTACHPQPFTKHQISTSVDFPGKQDGRMPARLKNKKGRPAEASLPCKNLESRISAQQHRRNGKSIQCPSNVTTYLGHTLFVGSALKLSLLLCNYAQQSGNRKPKPADVPYLSQLLLCDRKNHENVSSCAKRAVCLFDCVRLQRKCGVSTLYFA